VSVIAHRLCGFTNRIAVFRSVLSGRPTAVGTATKMFHTAPPIHTANALPWLTVARPRRVGRQPVVTTLIQIGGVTA
jgi:hypothetical protein